MTTKPAIAVIGSVNDDSTYYVGSFPRPGQTILSTSKANRPGGKGANQAVAIAAQGEPVDFLACVGSDSSGVSLLDHLAGRGVSVSGSLTHETLPTGSAVIIVSAQGENEIIVDPGANGGLSVDDVTHWLESRGSDILLTQLETPLETVCTAVRAHQGISILNPAPLTTMTPVAEEIIGEVDILVPNRDELAAIVGVADPTTPDEVRNAVHKLPFAGQVVVTLGGEGAMVFADGPTGPSTVVKATPVNPVDTSGAGDAFCGALAVAISHGASLVEATRHAIGIASWSVTQPGAQVGPVPKEFLISAN